VLVHGFLVSHWEWRHVIGPLSAAGFDVIALDLPGHGESDRPRDYPYGIPGFSDTVVGVMDALGIERAPLVGHSMGGAVALWTAARHPERASDLVVIDSACYPVEIPLDVRVALTPYVGRYIFKGVFGKRDIRRYFKNRVYRDPTLATEELIDYVYERMFRPGGQEAAHATLVALSNLSAVQASVRAVRTPTLVVWGEDDRVISLADGKRLVAEIPGARLEVIPACGHAPNEERPRELIEKLTAFLAEQHTRQAAAG
jgi:pimeloyl-ACP methyl ester carboxylesterase